MHAPDAKLTLVLSPGGTKVGTGFRSDGGIGFAPPGGCGTPVAPTEGIGATAAVGTAGGDAT